MKKRVHGNGLILTASEARAEACYIVLEIILTRLAESERRRIQAEAYVAADDCGIEEVRNEVLSLFPG